MRQTLTRKYPDGYTVTQEIETDPRRLLPGVTIDRVIEHLDSRYYLVDVREGLEVTGRNSSAKARDAIEKAVREGDRSPIYELIDNWYDDIELESVAQARNELLQTLFRDCEDNMHMYGWDIYQNDLYHDDERINDYEVYIRHISEGLELIIHDFDDGYREMIDSEIYQRNQSDPFNDTMSNTRDPIFHYRTGVELPYGGDNIIDNVNAVKRALKIPIRDNRWNVQLYDMCAESVYYGGDLVIYFIADVKEWAGRDRTPNCIEFTDPHIAITDRINGSGADCWIEGLTVRLPFDPENLYLEAGLHYNYTYEVCGMSSDWCRDTEVRLVKKGQRRHGTTLSKKDRK